MERLNRFQLSIAAVDRLQPVTMFGIQLRQTKTRLLLVVNRALIQMLFFLFIPEVVEVLRYAAVRM